MPSEQRPWKAGDALTYHEADAFWGYPPEAGTVQMPHYYDYFCKQDEAGATPYEQYCQALEIEPNGWGISEHLEAVEAAFDSYEYNTEETGKLFATRSQLRYLQALNRQVSSCMNEPIRDPRRAFVFEVFRSFSKDRPPEPWRDNLAGTIEFLNFYQQKLAEEVAERQLPTKLEHWRDQFANFVSSSSARRLVGARSAERAAYVARTVPITIADPLSALARREESDAKTELLGWFEPSRRRVSVDPFTADIFARHRRSTALPDMELKSTLFHELTHAFTAEHYTKSIIQNFDVDEDDNESVTELNSVQTHKLWPKFWNEGMTEKFAGYITGALADPDELGYSNYDPEPAERAAVSLSPKELLLSRKAAKIRGAEDFSYFNYRLLIDATFAKLDWAAAGLSERQAETLAAHAFAETPEDRSGKRLAFIQAVNTAAHPGFFMKLQHIVDLYGTDLAMDMMSSPGFDPHDPHALPFVSTKQMATARDPAVLKELISTSEKHIEMYKSVTAVYEHESKRLDKMRRALARQTLLLAAIEGQRALIEHNTPTIVHQDMAERRLLIAMFGGEASLEWRPRTKTTAELVLAREAITIWTQEAKTVADEPIED